MTKMKGCLLFPRFLMDVLILEAHHIFSRVFCHSCELKGHFYYHQYIRYPRPHVTCTKILKIRKCLETIETIFPLDGGTMCSYGKVLAIVEKPLNLPFGQRSAEDLARPRMKKPCPKKNTSRMFPARPPSRSLLMHLLKS